MEQKKLQKICILAVAAALVTLVGVYLVGKEQFTPRYWLFAGMAFGLMCLGSSVLLWKNRTGRKSAVVSVFAALSRYRFLIKQLVLRDFKTKYKRSSLGVLWSFLNPLLTMSVQYLVFSTLFHSDIPNFILYLLIGIVCFNYFNEATSLTLASIVGNASLITKVYVPKFTFPLTRVISSTINFLIALVPICIVMLLTGAPISPAMLLLPIPALCLFCLCLGVGMLLAASMVFFRDTQFLWGVISMVWMYATPIFYPASIIPARLQPLFRCNPMYQVLRFFRVILMDGVSPEPMAYVSLLIFTLAPLCLGLLVFKKTQDQFVLYL